MEPGTYLIASSASQSQFRIPIDFGPVVGDDAHTNPRLRNYYSIKRAAMKDIYDVIRQKEAELERVQREIDALRLSAKLLEDNSRLAMPATVPAYSVSQAKPQPSTPTATPASWASAKQFP